MLFERLNNLETCSYCAKRVDKNTLKPLPNDDNPELERKYCERCYPEVVAADRNLPWNKK